VSGPIEETDALPLLPLLNGVPLPGGDIAVELARAGSIAAVRRANAYPDEDPRHNAVLVATQTDTNADRPTLDDLHPIVVHGRLVQISPGLPGRMSIAVRLERRARLTHLQQVGSYAVGTYEPVDETEDDPIMAGALAKAVQELLQKHDDLLPKAERTDERAEALGAIVDERTPGLVADATATHIELGSAHRAEILAELGSRGCDGCSSTSRMPCRRFA
jgi:ATP-dependent Lon protease